MLTLQNKNPKLILEKRSTSMGKTFCGHVTVDCWIIRALPYDGKI